MAGGYEKESLIWAKGFKGITNIETGPDGNLYVLTFNDQAMEMAKSTEFLQNDKRINYLIFQSFVK